MSTIARTVGGLLLAALVGAGGARAEEPVAPAGFQLLRPGREPLAPLRVEDPCPEVAACAAAVLLIHGSDVECLDPATGKSLWRRSMGPMPGGVRLLGGGGGFLVVAPKTGPTWTCLAAKDGAVVASSADTTKTAMAADADAEGLAVLSSYAAAGGVLSTELNYRAWDGHAWTARVFDVGPEPRPLVLTEWDAVVTTSDCGLTGWSRSRGRAAWTLPRLFEFADPGDEETLLSRSSEPASGRIVAGPHPTRVRVTESMEGKTGDCIQVAVERETARGAIEPWRATRRCVVLQTLHGAVVRARELPRLAVGPAVPRIDSVLWACAGNSVARTVSRAELIASKGQRRLDSRLPLDLFRDWSLPRDERALPWQVMSIGWDRVFFVCPVALSTPDRTELYFGAADLGADVETWSLRLPGDWVDAPASRGMTYLCSAAVANATQIGTRLLVEVDRRFFGQAPRRLVEFDLGPLTR